MQPVRTPAISLISLLFPPFFFFLPCEVEPVHRLHFSSSISKLCSWVLSRTITRKEPHFEQASWKCLINVMAPINSYTWFALFDLFPLISLCATRSFTRERRKEVNWGREVGGESHIHVSNTGIAHIIYFLSDQVTLEQFCYSNEKPFDPSLLHSHNSMDR